LKSRPDRRSAFLAEACRGDSSLRDELESLLASHDCAGEFFETPALEVDSESMEVAGFVLLADIA